MTSLPSCTKSLVPCRKYQTLNGSSKPLWVITSLIFEMMKSRCYYWVTIVVSLYTPSLGHQMSIIILMHHPLECWFERLWFLHMFCVISNVNQNVNEAGASVDMQSSPQGDTFLNRAFIPNFMRLREVRMDKILGRSSGGERDSRRRHVSNYFKFSLPVPQLACSQVGGRVNHSQDKT